MDERGPYGMVEVVPDMSAEIVALSCEEARALSRYALVRASDSRKMIEAVLDGRRTTIDAEGRTASSLRRSRDLLG